MKNAYIKFRTKEDSAIGFDELINHSPISRLSNDIFCIPWTSLEVLDARKVNYAFATDEDLRNAQPIWNFADTRK